MIHILKLFFLVLKELIFDTKEEYDYRSDKFNTKKIMLMVLMVCSFFCNIWLLQRFYVISTDYINYRKEYGACEKAIVKEEQALHEEARKNVLATPLEDTLVKEPAVRKKTPRP